MRSRILVKSIAGPYILQAWREDSPIWRNIEFYLTACNHSCVPTRRPGEAPLWTTFSVRQALPAARFGRLRNGSQLEFLCTAQGLVLLVGFLTGLPARGTGQASAEAFEDRLAEGVKLLDEGHLLESVKVLNDAKQSAPEDARPYFYCGMALAQAGRMCDAASELGEAVHLAPAQLDYRVFQAHVLVELKQASAAQDALAVFQKEQMVEQLSPAWLRLLADVYYRLQITDPALKILDLWAQRDPTDARIDLYRGQVYVVKGQPEMALSFFRRSLEKSTQNPQAYFEMGTILYEKNQLLPAKNALLSAVREEADNPEYRSKLASVYLAMGDADAAIECLQSVEPAGSNIPMIYYILGRALLAVIKSLYRFEKVSLVQQLDAFRKPIFERLRAGLTGAASRQYCKEAEEKHGKRSRRARADSEWQTVFWPIRPVPASPAQRGLRSVATGSRENLSFLPCHLKFLVDCIVDLSAAGWGGQGCASSEDGMS